MTKNLLRIGLTLAAMSAALVANAATLNYTLYINSGTFTVTGGNGASMAGWYYSDVNGTLKIPGPVLTAKEGDTVNITVNNNHNQNHNFVIQGVTTDTTAIAPGGNRNYSFTASAAGEYIYSDTLNSNINRAMGMYGALVVGPADGSNHAWTNGPAYTFKRVWVTSEVDKARWNDVAGAGGTVNTSVYKPNYFLINGLGGEDAMADANTVIEGNVGQDALVQIINPGQFMESLHFHGNHFAVISVNGVHQTAPYRMLDTINIPPMTTVEVLYNLKQAGSYPMHAHVAQMEAGNGFYLNGSATMIIMH